jgi:hypothetical protein
MVRKGANNLYLTNLPLRGRLPQKADVAISGEDVNCGIATSTCGGFAMISTFAKFVKNYKRTYLK